MSSTVSFNGSTYIIPATGDVGWGSNVSNYLIAIAAGCLQKTGGAFTLSAETDFGASFGLKSLYYKTRGSNVASTGAFRLANAETGIAWRNAGNSADLALTVNASNQLTFNGSPIEFNALTSAHIFVGNGSNIATDVAMSGDISIDNTGLTAIGAGKIVNSQINSAAAIAITKIANGAANQVLGTNAGASANEWKTLTSTTNQVTVTQGVGTVTFSTPQDIGTASAVQHGSLALGGALDTSSILSLTSTTKGFLPPIMTTTQKNAISTPTNGLVVYDSSLAQLFLRSGGAWTPLSTGGGSGTVSSGTANQLTYYAGTGTTVSGLTAITSSQALASDTNGLPVASTTTAAELAFVHGVTSAIQTQLGLKAPLASPTFTGVALFASGTSGTPSIAFSAHTGDGFYSGGAGDVILQTSGADRIEVSTTKIITSNLILGASGSVTNPSYSFGADQTSGMYLIGSNDVGFSVSSTKVLELAASGNVIVTAGNLAFSSTSTQGIKGTTTNDSAAVGNVGETVLGNQTVFTNFPTSTQWGDLTSISLTAGDWLVWGTYQLLGAGGTETEFSIAVTTTTGNSTTGFINGLNNFSYRAASLTGTNEGQLTVPAVRFSLSGSTTVYLKYESTWSTTAPQAAGNIRALRIR